MNTLNTASNFWFAILAFSFGDLRTTLSPAAKPPKHGFLALALELIGRMRRNYSHHGESAHSMPRISQDMADGVRRESKVAERGREVFTVTYDIWRTVEDKFTGVMGKGKYLSERDREL